MAFEDLEGRLSSLAATDTTVSNCGGEGVLARGATVRLGEGTRVERNGGGALRLSSADVSVAGATVAGGIVRGPDVQGL